MKFVVIASSRLISSNHGTWSTKFGKSLMQIDYYGNFVANSVSQYFLHTPYVLGEIRHVSVAWQFRMRAFIWKSHGWDWICWGSPWTYVDLIKCRKSCVVSLPNMEKSMAETHRFPKLLEKRRHSSEWRNLPCERILRYTKSSVTKKMKNSKIMYWCGFIWISPWRILD